MTDAAVIERSDRPRPDAATVAEVTESPWRIELGPALAAGRAGGWPPVPIQSWVTLFVVAACAGFVFYVVHPDLIFRNTTPTGGDMGAHVWGPCYLREHLLPAGPGVGLVARTGTPASPPTSSTWWSRRSSWCCSRSARRACSCACRWSCRCSR